MAYSKIGIFIQIDVFTFTDVFKSFIFRNRPLSHCVLLQVDLQVKLRLFCSEWVLICLNLVIYIGCLIWSLAVSNAQTLRTCDFWLLGLHISSQQLFLTTATFGSFQIVDLEIIEALHCRIWPFLSNGGTLNLLSIEWGLFDNLWKGLQNLNWRSLQLIHFLVGIAS